MWWIINGIGLVVFWIITDLSSDSVIESLLAPALTAVFITGFSVKILTAVEASGGQRSGRDSGGFFTGGSGDGGGGCAGGGGGGSDGGGC